MRFRTRTQEAEANALRTAAGRFRVAHAKAGRVIVQLDQLADGLEAGVTERLHGTDDTDRLHEAGDN